MQKWEHLRVMWSGHNVAYGSAENVVVSISDGRLGGDRKNSIRVQLNKETKMSTAQFEMLVSGLGDEGWEMVGTHALVLASTASSSPFLAIHYAWFKRPKA